MVLRLTVLQPFAASFTSDLWHTVPFPRAVSRSITEALITVSTTSYQNKLPLQSMKILLFTDSSDSLTSDWKTKHHKELSNNKRRLKVIWAASYLIRGSEVPSFPEQLLNTFCVYLPPCQKKGEDYFSKSQTTS